MKTGQSTISRVLRYLRHDMRSMSEISSALNLGKGAVSKAVNDLHDVGVIHIGGFKRASNHLDAALYAFGPGEDAVSKRRPNCTLEPIVDDGVIPFALLPVWHHHIFQPSRTSSGERITP